MDKLDRLIRKAMSGCNVSKRLEENNLYREKTCEDLLELMDGENYQAPIMKSPEWDKFMYAIVHSYSKGRLTE